MEYIVTKTIPTEELSEHKDYINFLFKNKYGVYNICTTEEDVLRSSQWFGNRPLNVIVVSFEMINPGDTFLAVCRSKELNGKTFKYERPNYNGMNLIDLIDKNGNVHTANWDMLEDCYKVLRVANMEDKQKLVNGIIKPLDIKL